MDTDPHVVPTVVAVVVVVAAWLWVLIRHVAVRPRRPASGPVTMDLGPESPAVVDLLTDDLTVTSEAAPATIVDLAARRWLSIEDVGAGNLIIRLRTREPDDMLTAYERHVLRHLRELAVDGVVPAAAMTTGPDDVARFWRRRFRRDVIADAQRQGLCRDRWTRRDRVPLWGAVVVSGVAAWAALELGDTHDALAWPTLIGWVWWAAVAATALLGVWLAALPRRDLQRGTESGEQAASRWLGVREYLTTFGDFEDKTAPSVVLWDRHLAYAVALDLAPLVAQQLPLGEEDHRHAWSRASGRWRLVRVSYPFLRPGYGQRPLLAALGALVTMALSGVAVRLAARLVEGDVDILADLPSPVDRVVALVGIAVGAAAMIVIAWNVTKFVFAVGDLVRVEECEGVVLRRRVRRGWVGLRGDRSHDSDDHTRERYFLAIDTGEAEHVMAWRVNRRLFDVVAQGERVRVRVTPRLHHVAGIEGVTDASG